MKRWIAMLLAGLLCLSAAGCHRDDGSGHVIYFDAASAPATLDPLLARSQSEQLAVQNMFEPLLRVNGDGTVSPGAAASYTVSADGLTYTFTLRDGLFWSDEQPVTADDFVFALQRAVLPRTGAFCAMQLTELVNAAPIMAGQKEADTLGAQAADEQTLTIRLTRADDGLPAALAGPAGMPCRRDFFEACGGRYGMGRDYIVSNGAFAVSRWGQEDPDRYLRLAKNPFYHDAASVVPAAVHVTFYGAQERLTRLNEGMTDCAVLDSSLLKPAQDAGFHTLSYYSDCYGLVMNTGETAVTGNAHLRRALAAAADKTGYEAALPAWCEPTDGLIVPGAHYGAVRFAPNATGGVAYDPAAARRDFALAVEELGARALENVSLLYAEDGVAKTVLDRLAQNWQKQFGLYVKLTPVSADQLETALADGSFTLAFCAMGNAARSTLEVLQRFAPYGDEIYADLLARAGQAGDGDLTAQYQAQARLLDQGIILPAYATRAYYACAPNLAGLALDPAANVPIFAAAEKFS